MKTIQRLLFLAFFGTAIVGVSGCGAIEEAFDCDAICVEFQRCIEPNLHQRTCRDNCFDAIDRNSYLRNDADLCASCIAGRTCGEVATECLTCQSVYNTFN